MSVPSGRYVAATNMLLEKRSCSRVYRSYVSEGCTSVDEAELHIHTESGYDINSYINSYVNSTSIDSAKTYFDQPSITAVRTA